MGLKEREGGLLEQVSLFPSNSEQEGKYVVLPNCQTSPLI